MKILLVDDSHAIRSMQRKALSQRGYDDITEARDGVEAMGVIAGRRPDLMIVDWNMPEMDGLTLVRRVRETDEMLPIIMCSTEAELSRIQEAVRAGVNDYIVKPFSPETLCERVERAAAGASVGR